MAANFAGAHPSGIFIKIYSTLKKNDNKCVGIFRFARYAGPCEVLTVGLCYHIFKNLPKLLRWCGGFDSDADIYKYIYIYIYIYKLEADPCLTCLVVL